VFNNQIYQDGVALLARILLAALFVMAGYNKIVGFDGVVSSIAARGVPLPEIAAVLTILVELVGGLMIMVGLQARWAALALALFIIPVNFFYHPVWDDAAQFNAFYKNLCIMGGMLFLTIHGPGRMALQRG